MFIRNLSVLLGTLLLIFTVTDVSAYSKYGRTCQDIGCRSDEFCVIAEDACSTYERKNCGQYPTCKKKSDGASCSSLICGPNEYCRTENGHPQCVRKTSSNEYESAGVSVVNGQRIDGGSVNTNTHKNPFANANAPPEPPDVPFGNGGDYHRVHTGSDLGYPPDPPRSGYNSNNNNGYPAYPGYPPSSNNQGYPPYPTQNRMPVPGYPQQYPPQYPQQYPGSHHYPQSNPGGFQYPSGHSVYPQQNTPYQTQKGYGSGNSIHRYNSGSMISSSMIVIILSSCLIIFLTHKS